MRQFFLGVMAVLGLGIAAGGGLLYSGMIDVAADSPHGDTVHRLIEWARERSIHRAAGSITPPGDLALAERIRRGAGNYDAMCASCHLTPGVENSEIRQGLYPTPPNLSQTDSRNATTAEASARRFWIIKHGIRASAMPAWSRGGMDDDAIWDMVAFLEILPGLSFEQYRQQVEASAGHIHGGMEALPSQKDGHHENGASVHNHKEHKH